MSDTRPTVLVLRALGLGDVLTAVPALRAVADAYPEHRRVLAAPAALAPLVRLIGVVDDVLPSAPLAPLAVDGRPAVAVNLHGCGPQSHRLLLATRPRRLLAFAHPDVPESAGGPAWKAEEHEVTRWCRLLRECGIAADPTRLDLVPPPLSVLPATYGATLLHPGAAYAARRWPLERWAVVARAEVAAGRDVVVTAGPAEAPLARALVRRAGLSPRAMRVGVSLLELVALVAAAGRVVVGDTGVAHLATALGTPSVVLFGPSSPARWGPPTERRRHRVLWAGRLGDPHGTRPDPGLLAITPDDVLRALAELDRDAAAVAA